MGVGWGKDVSLNDFLNSEAINRTGSSPVDPLSLKLASQRWGPASLPSQAHWSHPNPRDDVREAVRPSLQTPSATAGTEEMF